MPAKVKGAIEEVVAINLKDQIYQQSSAHRLAVEITEKIKQKVKGLRIFLN